MSVKNGQVAEPLSLRCGTKPGFLSSSSRKQSLFATFYQKKLADRSVCSHLLNLVFVRDLSEVSRGGGGWKMGGGS